MPPLPTKKQPQSLYQKIQKRKSETLVSLADYWVILPVIARINHKEVDVAGVEDEVEAREGAVVEAEDEDGGEGEDHIRAIIIMAMNHTIITEIIMAIMGKIIRIIMIITDTIIGIIITIMAIITTMDTIEIDPDREIVNSTMHSTIMTRTIMTQMNRKHRALKLNTRADFTYLTPVSPANTPITANKVRTGVPSVVN